MSCTAKRKKRCVVYFGNDQDAYAAFNALTLKKFVRNKNRKNTEKSHASVR